MKFREKYTYNLICPTSIGVRITPADRQPVHTASTFSIQATSAESNVLSISASLGLKAKILTTFVKDSVIAKLIKGDLRRRGIDYEGPEIAQSGPWGYRHQFNIADSGFGLRAPQVQNDRAGEVGLTLDIKDFDIDCIFGEEGVQMLHISGLIASLSKETGEFCLALAKAANARGTKISFDLNYRASFWANRKQELSKTFADIANVADMLIGNEEDFQLALGIKGPETGGDSIENKIEDFKGLIERVEKIYPNAQIFATTLRQVNSANEHLWGAILKDGDDWTVIEPKLIQVYDRIGGGDGFVGGLIYGYLSKWSSHKSTQFGWATGAYVASIAEDFGLPLSEEQIWAIYDGNARVKR